MSVRTVLRSAGACLERFRRHEGASILVMACFVFVVLITAVAATIDYSRAAAARTQLQIAADQAVIAVMRQMQVDGVPAAPLGANDTACYLAYASAVFMKNTPWTPSGAGPAASCGGGAPAAPAAPAAAGGGGGGGLTPAVPTFDVVFSDSNTKATASFETMVPLAFGGVLGMSSVKVGGVAVASRPLESVAVADVHFLVDTSASMGLAATAAGRTLLKVKTNEAVADETLGRGDADCTFACHTPRQLVSGVTAQKSTLDIAIENGIELRIDVAKSALASVFTLAESAKRAGHSDIRFSLNAFNTVWTNLTDIESDYNALRRQAGLFKMGYPNITSIHADANTTIDDNRNIPAFARWMNGPTLHTREPSTENRKQYVVLVTDGVRSQAGMVPASGLVRVFDQAECRRIKDTGATLVVIYTTYLPDPGNLIFESHVDSILPDIEPNLRLCASRPSLFAMGDSPAEIEAAFKDIFEAIQLDASSLRLTH